MVLTRLTRGSVSMHSALDSTSHPSFSRYVGGEKPGGGKFKQKTPRQNIGSGHIGRPELITDCRNLAIAVAFSLVVRTRAVVSSLYSGFGKRFSQELPWTSHSGIEQSTGPISNFLPIHRGSLPAKPSSCPGEMSLCFFQISLSFRQLFHFQCVRCTSLYDLTTLVLQDSRIEHLLSWNAHVVGLEMDPRRFAGLPERLCTHLA